MMEEILPGVVLTKLQAHEDERGHFSELFRASDYSVAFVQSNHSHTRAGGLRALHFHREQSDLWFVISGRAQVGLVDLRHPPNPTTAAVYLDATEPSTLFIPPGVAHGFLAVTDVDLIYWVTREYDASDEYGIKWDDPQLDIAWESRSPTVSDRDRSNPPLRWGDIPPFS